MEKIDAQYLIELIKLQNEMIKDLKIEIKTLNSEINSMHKSITFIATAVERIKMHQ